MNINLSLTIKSDTCEYQQILNIVFLNLLPNLRKKNFFINKIEIFI